ncbi:MAG TPA: hypothetical protein PKN33_13410 [Phycisphaerae bacterium]|nr:hypothetical protein [Phycisphaerae bacterium]
MFFLTMFRHAVFAFLIPLSLVANGAAAFESESGPAASFYKAYYLQQQGDVAGAAKLYAETLKSGQIEGAIKDAAQKGLTECREELACADFASLMPEDALAYIELSRPGKQIHDLLDMLGLLSDGDNSWAKPGERYLAISPILVNELAGIRGVAVAITGVDPIAGAPAGVAVLHPGSVDAIRGALETALPAAAVSVPSIANRPTYMIEEKVYVTLTSRLIVVSPQRAQIEAVINRLDGKAKSSLATSEALSDVLASRGKSLLFFCVNAKPIVPMIQMMGAASEELAIGNAVLDLNSFKWIAGKFGVEEDGPQLELAVSYEEGQQNLAYNLLRTPPISREILSSIPSGAAGFIASALGESSGKKVDVGNESANRAVIGLDYGREIFANIVDFAVCVVSPKEGSKSKSPAPDVAVVIRVNDPTKSEKLWQQVLGLITMAAGAPTTDGIADSISEVAVRAYRFPENVNVFFATVDDKVILATSRHAAQLSIEASQGGPSVLDDKAFAPGISRMTASTSKAVLVHPKRCLEVAKRFMSERELEEVKPVHEMIGDLVLAAMTDESDVMFRLSMSASSLPNIGPMVAAQLQKEFESERMHAELNRASRSKNWDQALAALDQLESSGESNMHLDQKRLEILALGKGDREQVVELAKTFADKYKHHANALNVLAWNLLTEKKYEGKYNDIALKLAERACEASNQSNWAILDTAALANFKTGNIKRALELQEKAIEKGGSSSQEAKARLEEYRVAEAK